MMFFFFFQAEDGIRDYKVTGVQTCALPIYGHDDDFFVGPIPELLPQRLAIGKRRRIEAGDVSGELVVLLRPRSEERRVGKECRSRWGRCDREKTRGNDGVIRTVVQNVSKTE